MVGEVNVAFADQKATVEFLGSRAVLRFDGYASAWALLKHSKAGFGMPGMLLRFDQMVLKAQVGKRQPFELFPRPGLIVRWLSPVVRAMLQSANG